MLVLLINNCSNLNISFSNKDCCPDVLENEQLLRSNHFKFGAVITSVVLECPPTISPRFLLFEAFKYIRDDSSSPTPIPLVNELILLLLTSNLCMLFFSLCIGKSVCSFGKSELSIQSVLFPNSLLLRYRLFMESFVSPKSIRYKELFDKSTSSTTSSPERLKYSIPLNSESTDESFAINVFKLLCTLIKSFARYSPI